MNGSESLRCAIDLMISSLVGSKDVWFSKQEAEQD